MVWCPLSSETCGSGALWELCQPDQSNNGKEIVDNIGNGLQELLVFHAPGGGTGPSLSHRSLDRRSVGYGVKSILDRRSVWNGGLPVLPQTGDTDNGALIPGTASSRNFSSGSNREFGAFAGAINVDAGSDELVLSVSDLSATFGCFLFTHSWQR